MFVQLDETLQLALDCVAMLSPRRGVAYGWATTPRGVETALFVSAGPDGDCVIEHCSFHPRTDVATADPRRAVVSGFTLVFESPEEPVELVLALSAGGAALRLDMRDPRIEGNLLKATADRAWGISFGLLREAAGSDALATLLRHGGRPFGAFSEWMARLPALRGRAEGLGFVAEAEALAAPSGEVLAVLRMAAALPAEAELDIAVIGWLHGADGLPEPAVLPLADRHAARLPAALAIYARPEPGITDRLQAVELVIRAIRREGEEVWLRCHPQAATVPELLDGACRAVPRLAAPALEAAAAPGLDLLRQIIARREAAFAPMLGTLGAPAEGAGAARLPRLGLILGLDDPAAVRLFHVTPEEFERRCDRLLVMGSVADDVAQIFARRGRIEVLAGVEAAATLRQAAGRAGVLAVDAVAYAQAVAEGRPEAAFSRPLEAGDLARLLALHQVAGCSAALTDSLQRLLRQRRAAPGEPGFAPVLRSWGNRHAADLVNGHLQRLWSLGRAAPRAVAEPALHV